MEPRKLSMTMQTTETPRFISAGVFSRPTSAPLDEAILARFREKARYFKRDVLASVVVFLVALPLCMGIANACGLPPSAGIITGIVGGLLVGLIAGSPLQVSGPAAGLVVTLSDIVRNEHMGLGMLGAIVLCAGALQIAAGFFRLGQWFRAVSPAVIEGMLAGIGVLIVASQLHVMVDAKPVGDGIANLCALPASVMKTMHDPVHAAAGRIGFLTLLVLILWKTIGPHALRAIPAPLIAIIAGTLSCIAARYPALRVAMPANLVHDIHFPTLNSFTRLGDSAVLIAICTVAFIASAETLLCATAVDGLHTGPRTQYDRELMAQGLGNALCGLFGALPMTGVIVRSAANVEAGAKTRLAAILHGCWLLLTVAFFSTFLSRVPTASLAAVLVYTGYKLVNLRAIRELWHYSKSEVLIYFATLLAVVSTDLLKGVLVGIALSAAKLLCTFSRLAIRLETDPKRERAVLHLEGAATFLRLPQLAAALEKVGPTTCLRIEYEYLTYVDFACLDLLLRWEKQHIALGGALQMDWQALTAKFNPDSRTPMRPDYSPVASQAMQRSR
jgi:MFS superfamily sulfate permease-like transporter